MTPTNLLYADFAESLLQAPIVSVIGTKPLLERALQLVPFPASLAETNKAFANVLAGLSKDDSASFFVPTGEKTFQKYVFSVLTTETNRNNAVIRADAVHSLVKKSCEKKEDVSVILLLEDGKQSFAAGIAAARAFPVYSRKTSSDKNANASRNVTVSIIAEKNSDLVDLERIRRTAAAIRKVSRLVDTPTSEMNTDDMVAEAETIAKRFGITPVIIRGEELKKKGFGGLYNVGKAASNPPALVVLGHVVPEATQTVAWVGKGIVYDTGGLSIKGSSNMPGMKRDMTGAATMLCAFEAAVSSGKLNKTNLYAVLCLAENAVSDRSYRNDDIIQLYSGKTIEINNTDAEGRLVVGDGVAYASKHLKPDIIVDMATLTGAQGVTTGKKHSAVLCNNEELERETVAAGKITGDLVFPMLYAPEFLMSEFKSEVADYKNSVKDRANAQSSCAGHFIEAQLVDFHGKWLHLDVAYPIEGSDERATGHGVALLLELIGA